MHASRFDVSDVLFVMYLAALVISGAGTGWMLLTLRRAWSRLGALDALRSASCAEAQGRDLQLGGRVVPLRTFLSPMSHKEVVFAQVRRLHEDDRPRSATTVNPDLAGPWHRYPGFAHQLADQMGPSSGPEQVLAELTMGEPFYLDDGTGRVLVQPEVVPCALPPTVEDGKRKELIPPAERPTLYHLEGVLERRLGYSFWVERAVSPGDTVYAHGDVSPAPASRPMQEGEPTPTLRPRLLSSVARESLLGRQTWRLVLAAVGAVCGLVCPLGLLLLPAPAAHPLLTRLWLWVWIAALLLNLVLHWMVSTRRTLFHRLSSRGGLLATALVMVVAAVYIFQYHGVRLP